MNAAQAVEAVEVAPTVVGAAKEVALTARYVRARWLTLERFAFWTTLILGSVWLVTQARK